METPDLEQQLEIARRGIEGFLDKSKESGQIDEGSYQEAKREVPPKLRQWLVDDEEFVRVSPNVRSGILRAIEKEAWEDLVNTFRRDVKFGTGGIRGMMAFDYDSIETLKKDGLQAPILKGPNTINDIVLLRVSAGVAKFGKAQSPPLEKVVIGYDSRVRGHDFAKIVAELFLHYGYTVYFFDEPCPYPEMTFAIPYKEIKGDIGILISASHNDYRYNGYKLSCGNGSQFDPEERKKMYDDYISKATAADIRLLSFADAAPDKLIFLGGSEPLPDFDYLGREGRILNIHEAHCDHVKSFILTPDLAEVQQAAADPLRIAYCAYHGAGRRAVPRLLKETGFVDVRVITHNRLNELDGLFPEFCHDAGKEQQPDPGDERAAKKAVEGFQSQGDLGSFDEIDILIGTDPDADRCGVVVKVPADQRELYDGRDWTLLPADGMWALLLWYRFQREIERHGKVEDAAKKFIVLSHTTSDSIALLARKHGLGVIKTWVGFAALAAAVRDVWENQPVPKLTEGRESATDKFSHSFVCQYYDIEPGQRSINVAAMEQSNGFSILGGPPPDARSLGVGGHVRDKDGTLAALLVAEIAAWAKQQGTTIFELIDRHVWLDPQIGLFVNGYEPDPLDGEYPGIQGDQKKKAILRRALAYFQLALAGDLTIAGQQVTSATVYRTGKYDKDNPPTLDFQFPDEGIRFYLGSEFNHVTVRPSGTGNSLRFHTQLHDPNPGPDAASLLKSKRVLMRRNVEILDELRERLKAPRT